MHVTVQKSQQSGDLMDAVPGNRDKVCGSKELICPLSKHTTGMNATTGTETTLQCGQEEKKYQMLLLHMARLGKASLIV